MEGTKSIYKTSSEVEVKRICEPLQLTPELFRWISSKKNAAERVSPHFSKMFHRFLLLAVTIIYLSFPASGQGYFDLIIIPKLFQNVYAQIDQDVTRTASCTINDSITKKVVIKYQENGSIRVSDILTEYSQEEFLIFDDKKRVKEYGNTSAFGSESIYYFRYPDENVVIIEYFESDVKKSVSTLTYSSRRRLKEFKQTQILDPDSIAEFTHTVKHRGNEMIITHGKFDEKYKMNKQGQLLSHSANDVLLLSVEYSKTGRVLSEIHYFYSILTARVILREHFYSYSNKGRLSHTEDRFYYARKVAGLHCCAFEFGD